MGGFSQLNLVVARLVRTLFPPACPLCLATLPAYVDDPFCPDCSSRIKPLTGACCSCCSLPFSAEHNSSHLCSRCLKHPPAFEHVYAYGIYDGALAGAIQQFKFAGKVGLDRLLAGLMASSISADLHCDLVVPVPLQRRQLQQRCYNQALLLAREVAGIRGWTVDHRCLMKIRETEPQHHLDASERDKNLRGAFAMSRPLQGEHVLLIDDVMTTGATVSACSAALLDGGAGKVSVAVIARAAK